MPTLSAPSTVGMVKAVVDYRRIKPEAGAPLDYSFKDLEKLADLAKTKPVSGRPKGQAPTPHADPSTAAAKPDKQPGTPSTAAPANPTSDATPAPATTASAGSPAAAAVPAKRREPATTYNATAVRLNNNKLTSLQGLDQALAEVLDSPAALRWLDCSHNQLTHIEEVVAHYPALQMLYLHANHIERLSEVKKLAALARLTKLTLHGNPVAEKKDYRLFVAAHLPQLTELDFVGLTKVDRDDSVQYAKMKLKPRDQH